MQQSPLNDQQKKQYDAAVQSTFRILLIAIKLLLLLVISILAYIPLRAPIQEWLKPKPILVLDKYKPKTNTEVEQYDLVENGIHVATGLRMAPGFEDVRANCTVCHSAKLVTQNRATREGWDQMLDWMQETQGLWDLGPKRARILDYLAEHYAPEAQGRRASIDVEAVEWYILNLE